MPANRFAWLAIVIFSGAVVAAQVVPAVEIQDPGLRKMQQDATPQLRQVGKNIAALHFDYPFYFSRKLDVDERQQQRLDQHSIRFEHFNGASVVAISGNYYGAYSSVKFSEERRARETFLNVVLPILKATVPVFRSNPVVQGYAVEVSHHVFGKTMGMPIERAENLMVYVPQGAAVKLVEAQNKMQQEVAMLESKVFLNANPIDIWLTEDEQPGTNELQVSKPGTFAETTAPATLKIAVESLNEQPLPANPAVEPNPTPFATPPPPTSAPPPTPAPGPIPVRDTSPETLAALSASIEGVSNQLVKELEPQAHFITYAPPAMIAFRHQVYLELSISTTISEPPGTSRYKLAALAFDDHISPLIRRVLNHFPGNQSFDGISFSTTVHAPVKAGNSPRTQTPISVEFFFPLSNLRCYESFDCSGQQLIDAGTVLINGERVTLDLQLAEDMGRP